MSDGACTLRGELVGLEVLTVTRLLSRSRRDRRTHWLVETDNTSSLIPFSR